jgi:hypothetical protein
MALRVALEVVWLDIHDAPFVNITRRDVACGDQVTQPLRGIGVDLVVVSGHQAHTAGLLPRWRLTYW